jgi:hypothetical protein
MTLVEQLLQLAVERRERYKTIEYDELPGREQVNERHIEGIISKVLLPTKQRWLRKKSLIWLGDVDGVSIAEAPTTLARDYLKVRGFRAARLRGSTKELLWNTMQRAPAFPQFAKPGTYDDGYYLDVRKAFYAIMHVVGWNVAYAPGKFLLRGEPPRDFPFADNPTARNSLVTCSTRREIYAIDPPSWSPIRLAHFNVLLNTSLNVLIRDVLHAIASVAVAEGACYVHTDGYIAPSYRVARRIGQVIEDFGLAYSVKGRGQAQVSGLGAYRVGTKVSKLADRRPSEIRAVAQIESLTWLQHRMESLAAMDGALNLRSEGL